MRVSRPLRESIMPQDRNEIPQYQDGDDDDRFPYQDDSSEEFEVEQVDESRPRTRKRPVAATGGRSWLKILLILFGVGVVSMALCCGGVLWWGSKSLQMTEDPVKIAAAQQEIAEIQVMPNLQPKVAMTMNLGIMNMRVVGYNSAGRSSLMLMQMQLAGQSDEQMQQNFRQQGQQRNDQFRVETAETRKITVGGVERDFLFAKGTIQPEGGAPMAARQITGMFPSRNGMGYLIVTIEEGDYDEAAVVKMIESIKK